MIDSFARADLQKLAEVRSDHCVSIYLPTERVTQHAEQSRIRLKNLLAKAEAELKSQGAAGTSSRDLLKPVQQLLDDKSFWPYLSEGLALFQAPGAAHRFRLPVRFDELAVVADRFHLKPLFPLLSGDGRFFVLALSEKQVRLLEGTRDSVEEIDLQNVPQTLAGALRFDDPEKQLQFHTGAAAGAPGQRRDAMFHGHGVGTDDQKDNLRRFFQKVDRGLADYLRNENAPLVLASVDYYLPIYEEASTYPHLVAKNVAGNPQQLSDKDLHRQAWEVVRPLFEQTRREAAAQFEQSRSAGKASTDVKDVLLAAQDGKVGDLFVAVGTQRWGKFDPQKRQVEVHEQKQGGDVDLLDVAAVATWSSRGTVYAVPPQDVPGGGVLAAIHRY